MHIAICDDEISEQDMIANMLAEYNADRKTEHTYTLFPAAAELTQAILGGAHFDLLLLDIVMPKIDGITAAKEIREKDKRVEIVFLTNSPDFALASYSVRARHYLVKPIPKQALFSLLDEIDQEITQKDAETIIVNAKSGLQRLMADRLEYCEIIGRTVFYHMQNGSVIEQNGNMQKLESVLLSLPQFIKPHRSYIVNINYITRIDRRKHTIEMQSLRLIPIPKAKYSEVNEAMQIYLEQKGGKAYEKFNE